MPMHLRPDTVLTLDGQAIARGPFPLPDTHHPDLAESADVIRQRLNDPPCSTALLVFDDEQLDPDSREPEPVLMNVFRCWGLAPYVGQPAIYVWRVAQDMHGRYIAGSAVYTIQREVQPPVLIDPMKFLDARITEDEKKIDAMRREGERVATAPAFAAHPVDWLAGVDIFVNPDRWRAECAAKRRIMAEHTTRTSVWWPDDECLDVEVCECCSGSPPNTEDDVEAPCPTIRYLLALYADDPEYDPNWAPGEPEQTR